MRHRGKEEDEVMAGLIGIKAGQAQMDNNSIILLYLLLKFHHFFRLEIREK